MKKTNCPNLAKNLIILLILSLIFAILFSSSIYALSSDNINLQGKIVRNDTGHEGMNVIPGSPACVVNGPSNDTCDFRVSYYTALTGGTLLLTEDFTNVEIGQFDGVFELSLGSGTITTTVQCRDGTCNSPSEVISEYGDLYIELQFAPDGSTLTETFTRMPLEASPYAIFSKFAEGAHDAFKLSTSVSNESLENPSAGMIYFDTGSSQLKVYNGAEWQALSAGTSSSLWTDAGTYSYLTSTTDDLVLGGSSFSTGRFIFDMDGGSGSYFDIFNNDHSNKLFTILSSGNVGIGTATPGAKLEVGGTASTISNNSGDITIDPVSNLVVTSRVYQTGLGGSTYFGENAGRVDDLSSNYNTGIGYNSLYSNTTGSYNTAVGYNSLRSNATGVSNTALGYYSLYSNTTGGFNTALGLQSLYSNTTGTQNTALGYNSLLSNTSGSSNTALGSYSLRTNSTGSYNIALGYSSLYSNTTGHSNTAIGTYAGVYQADGSTALTDPEYSIYIGYNAKGKDNYDNNSIVIGYNAIGLGANTVVLGNDSIVTTALKGNVGIGTTSPAVQLHTTGGVRFAGLASASEITAVMINGSGDLSKRALGSLAFSSSLSFLNLSDTPTSYTGMEGYLVAVNSSADGLEFIQIGGLSDDNYVDSVTFNTGDGVLTLGRTGELPDLTTNLDGRYLQSLRWNEIQNPNGSLILSHGGYTTSFTFNSVTTNTAFSMSSSSLSSGYVLGLSTSSTGLINGGVLNISANGAPVSSWTGDLVKIEYDNVDANVDGNALKVGLLGASAAGSGTAVNITTSQIGTGALALRVNDDSTYTDPSPFVVDANGNVGVGVVSPTSKLVVNSEGYSTIELQYNGTPVVDIFSNISSNIFIGLDSGSVITSGYGNVALGDNALSATTIGTSNTAVGYYALDSNVAKQGSTAIGYQAMMYADSTATQGLSYNTAVGYQALVGSATASANTGMYNTAIGHQSMTVNTSGSYNSTLGVNTLLNNTIGQYNVAIGYGALFTNVAKNASVAIGYEAMRYADNTVTSSTSGNIAIGYQALRGSTTASSNTGTNNVAIGYQVLYGNTTGSNSVLIGAFAGTGNTTGEYNVGIGRNALQTNVAKSKNVAIGYDAMSYANNSASVGDTYNTALGASALRGSSIPENNTGVYNTSIGGNSGLSMTSGSNNALLGYYAGYSITTGSNNSLFGYYAGSNLTTGSNNIIIGANISADSATGSYQLNIGDSIKGNLSTGDINIVGNLGINGVPYTWPSANGSGLLTNDGSGGLSWTTSEGLGLVSGTGSAGQISYWSSTTSITGSNSFWWDSTNSRLGIGTNTPQATLSVNGLVYQTGLGGSTYFGENAGRVDDLSSNNNTGIGFNSLYSNTTGDANTAVGYRSLYSNTTGYANTAVGYRSLYSNTSGRANAALGYYSLYLNTTGYANTAVGYRSLYSNTTGTYNTALGYDTLYSNTTGDANTALGYYTLYSNTTGINSIAIGYFSLYSNTSGGYNTALGNYSLRSNTTGYYNTALGAYSLRSNTTGFENTAVGKDSLYTNTTGYYNTAVGHGAGRYQADGTTALTNAKYSIYIGHSAKGKDDYDDNSIVIGYNAIGLGANTVVLGNDSIVTTALKGSVGIGTTTPRVLLDVSGTRSNTISYSTAIAGIGGADVRLQIGALNGSPNYGVWIQSERNYEDTVFPLLLNPLGGNVGIGTTNPGNKLTVVGGGSFSDTLYSTYGGASGYALRVSNTNSNMSQYYSVSTFEVADQTGSDYEYFATMSRGGASPDTEFRFATSGRGFSDSGWTTPADYAEYFETDDINLMKGELVSLNSTSSRKISRADKNSHSSLIGVISTKPGFIGLLADDVTDTIDKIENDPHWKIVGMLGQVPVIVSSENGPINSGDPITLSSMVGVGTKAKSAGQIIGKALDNTSHWNTQSCLAVDSPQAISWPEDTNGTNTTLPCFILPDGTYVGKILVLVNVTWYDPKEITTTKNITTPGWYRISKLDTNDDHSNIKINNTSVGSSQNLVLSIDSTLNNQNINIVSNLTTGEYDITKARIHNENGIKYLEIYIPEVNENKISVKITESSNWIATDIVQITEEVNNAQEYALSGILFGISDKLEVEEDNVKIAGNLLSLSVNSSIGDSANRWNDIYAKGTIRLGSGVDGEGAIRFNVQTKTLEFSNNGVEWLSVGDLSSQMTISPEYAGAILFADGSDNSGIMTSDAIEESGSFKNYYEWVSNKDTPQDYDILVRITLPADFLSWKEDAIYLDIMTENSVNTDNNSVGLSLIGNSGTDVQITGGISKIAGAWERMSIKGADITQCNSAGETCTLRISLTSSMEYFTRVGDITLNYNRSL